MTAESQALDLERLSELWGTYQDLRNHDVNKNLLIEKLFGEVNNLCVALERTKVQLADAEELKAIYYGRQKENATKSQALEAEKQRLQRDMFVYVLIDGDSMLFNDELIQDGENGGHEAASLLKNEIEQYLNTFDLINRPTIRVQIFASLRGLAKSYVDAGVISDPATFQLFIRGFNMENALYEFIEAGNGKECADEKIRENFKLHVSIMQCRQIIFGGSTDNAYARLLGPYSRDEDYVSRITMLEGAPFAMELRPFKNIFATTSFTSVFRNTKLEIKPSNYTPPPSVASTTSYSTIASAKNTAITIPMRTKSAAAVIEPLPPAPPSVSESAPASPPRPAEPKLLQNKAGHRVDSIIKYNELTVKEVKSRKMCNNFHLNGFCPYGDECGHTHGKKLSDRQLEALRYIARTSPCGNGVWCELPSCVSGHRCPREPNCELYAIGKCRFKDNMHNVDMKVVDPYDVYIIK